MLILVHDTRISLIYTSAMAPLLMVAEMGDVGVLGC